MHSAIPNSNLSEMLPKQAARRDLIVLVSFLVAAIIFALLFDTGSIADWVANHKGSKIDEIIVASFALTFGLSVFSLRRWREITRQVQKYEMLHAQMSSLTRESSLLAELGELLQS